MPCANCGKVGTHLVTMDEHLIALQDEMRAVRADLAEVRLQLTDIKPLVDMAKAYLGGTSGKLLSAFMKGKQRGT